MPRVCRRIAGLAFAAGIFTITPVYAQTIHLPPVFRPVLPQGETVLTLRVKECNDDIMSIGARDSQLLLARPHLPRSSPIECRRALFSSAERVREAVAVHWTIRKRFRWTPIF
jgi:hypothetical protein